MGKAEKDVDRIFNFFAENFCGNVNLSIDNMIINELQAAVIRKLL